MNIKSQSVFGYKIPELKAITKTVWGLVIVMIAIISIIYFQTFQFDFLNWDDNSYVKDNVHLHELSWGEIKYQFSRFEQGNYHPITMLSYALDLKLAGLNAGWFHIENVVFHLFNTLLVFGFIYLLTGEGLIAIFTALLFNIYPTRVEAVAWISSRKDMLYVFFGLLSLISYLWYRRKDRKLFYFTSLTFFIAACLSKGMAVSIAPVIFIIDWYMTGSFIEKKFLKGKIPFAIIALLFGIIAVIAQKAGGAVGDFQQYNFMERIIFAASNIFIYLVQQIIPVGLKVYYPYPENNKLSPLDLIFAVITFVFIVLWIRKKLNRNSSFGLLFFLVCILPVLQLLPVGEALRADRYTYFSGIGFSFVLSSIFILFFNRWKMLNEKLMLIFFISYVLMLSAVSFHQCTIWKNSITLWNHAIEKSPRFATAYGNRGIEYFNQKQYDKAFNDFNKFLTLKPENAIMLSNRGLIYVHKKEYEKAIDDFNHALAINAELAPLYANMAFAILKIGKFNDAITYCNYALQRDSFSYEAWATRGFANLKLHQLTEAKNNLSKSLSIKPDNATTIYYQGLLSLENADTASACACFKNSALQKLDDEDFIADVKNKVEGVCQKQ